MEERWIISNEFFVIVGGVIRFGVVVIRSFREIRFSLQILFAVTPSKTVISLLKRIFVLNFVR
jgi:hypothetical protein